jgi:hypothetical protein
MLSYHGRLARPLGQLIRELPKAQIIMNNKDFIS